MTGQDKSWGGIFPSLCTPFAQDGAGSFTAAEALFRRLLPYLAFSLQDLDYYNACTKEMLVRRGILSRAGLREPAPRLSTLGLDLLNGHSAKLELSAPAPGLPVMP